MEERREGWKEGRGKGERERACVCVRACMRVRERVCDREREERERESVYFLQSLLYSVSFTCHVRVYFHLFLPELVTIVGELNCRLEDWNGSVIVY